MDIVEILRQDYQRFPQDQTYELYARDVSFKDPLTAFRGLDRYQQMIRFMQTWFIDTRMDLHHIERQDNLIKTHWTLSWNAPLPWKPRLAITGRSELILNQEGLIISHFDAWDISRRAVLLQLIPGRNKPAPGANGQPSELD